MTYKSYTCLPPCFIFMPFLLSTATTSFQSKYWHLRCFYSLQRFLSRMMPSAGTVPNRTLNIISCSSSRQTTTPQKLQFQMCSVCFEDKQGMLSCNGITHTSWSRSWYLVVHELPTFLLLQKLLKMKCRSNSIFLILRTTLSKDSSSGIIPKKKWIWILSVYDFSLNDNEFIELIFFSRDHTCTTKNPSFMEFSYVAHRNAITVFCVAKSQSMKSSSACGIRTRRRWFIHDAEIYRNEIINFLGKFDSLAGTWKELIWCFSCCLRPEMF